MFDLVILTLELDLLLEDFNLKYNGRNFWTVSARVFVFTCVFLVTRPFLETKSFDLLTLTFEILLINLNHAWLWSTLLPHGGIWMFQIHLVLKSSFIGKQLWHVDLWSQFYWGFYAVFWYTWQRIRICNKHMHALSIQK